MIASFASIYLCQMLNLGIDRKKLLNKFFLMHWRYNEWNGAFENLAVCESYCQPMR